MNWAKIKQEVVVPRVLKGTTDFCIVTVCDRAWTVVDKDTGKVVATGVEESHDRAKEVAEQAARRHDREVLRQHRVLSPNIEDNLDTLLDLALDGLLLQYETSRRFKEYDYKKYEFILPKFIEGLKALVRTVNRLVAAQEAETVQAELASLRKQYEALVRLEADQ